MRRVCICENVHFRFIYTPSFAFAQQTMPPH